MLYERQPIWWQEPLGAICGAGIVIGAIYGVATACNHEAAQKPVRQTPYTCLKSIESLSLPAEVEIDRCGITFKSINKSSGENVRGARSIFDAPKCTDVEALGLGKDQIELDSLERLRRTCTN